MEKARLKVLGWIKENRTEFLILVLILLLGAFFRLYKINDYMTFLGDEGRDAIIVRRLLAYGDPILIGPGTSIGNMYLGPLYYYMMAPALFLANFSPVGPAIQIALLGVVTILFVWWVGREWFPSANSGQVNIGALIAAGLYAVSPTVIIYSRSSWNPNIMPFFSLLTIYATWKFWTENEWRWFLIAGISFAFVLQSHYLGLLLAPVLLFFWILKMKNLKLAGNWKPEIGNFIKYSVAGLGIFAVLMSPLVIFDARHGWRNFSAMKKFFGERQTTVSARPWTSAPKLWPTYEKAITRLAAGRQTTPGRLLSVALAAGLFWMSASVLYSNVAKKQSLKKGGGAYLILLTWIGFAILGLSLYKQEIYDHYYGFFFAAPFLLLGGLSQKIMHSAKNKGKILIFIILLSLLAASIFENPLKYNPNGQLRRSEEVAKKIVKEAKGEKFNLAVLAERNYEDGYQYFLELFGAPVVDIDAQKPETITEQLFAVCELPPERCDPAHSPKAEVANFGWSKVETEWKVSGITIYKLIHTK